MARKRIIQGSDRILNLTIRDANGDPIDLNGVTEITVCFKATGGGQVTFTLSGAEVSVNGNALLGKIVVTMSDTKTSLIEAGLKIDFEALLDTGAHPGGSRQYVQFYQQIDVLESVC